MMEIIKTAKKPWTWTSLKSGFISPLMAFRYRTKGRPPSSMKVIATSSFVALAWLLKEASVVEKPPVEIVVSAWAIASKLLIPAVM